jgi:hypothetical protein
MDKPTFQMLQRAGDHREKFQLESRYADRSKKARQTAWYGQFGGAVPSGAIAVGGMADDSSLSTVNTSRE